MASRSEFQLRGLQVHQNPIQLEDMSAIVADNVVLQKDGFKSAFHHNVTEWRFSDDHQSTAFDIGNDVYIMRGGVVYVMRNGVEGSLEVFRDYNSIHPNTKYQTGTWTYAKFFNKVVICNSAGYHHVFEIKDGKLLEQKSIVGIKNDLRYITEYGNRLIYVTTDIVGWSAVDAPEKVTQSLSADSGAQELSLVSATARPMGVSSNAEGVYVFTTEGVMSMLTTRYQKNSAVSFPFVFGVVARHEHAVVSNFAVVGEIKQSIMFVSHSGLYTIDRTQVKEVNKDISSFLLNQIRPKHGLEQLRLIYDPDNGNIVFHLTRDKIAYVNNILTNAFTTCTYYGSDLFRFNLAGVSYLGFSAGGKLAISGNDAVSTGSDILRIPNAHTHTVPNDADDLIISAASTVYVGDELNDVVAKRLGRLSSLRPMTAIDLAPFTGEAHRGSISHTTATDDSYTLDMESGSGYTPWDLDEGADYFKHDLEDSISTEIITATDGAHMDAFPFKYVLDNVFVRYLVDKARLVYGYFRVEKEADQSRQLFIRLVKLFQGDRYNAQTFEDHNAVQLEEYEDMNDSGDHVLVDNQYPVGSTQHELLWHSLVDAFNPNNSGAHVLSMSEHSNSVEARVNHSNKFHAFELRSGSSPFTIISLNSFSYDGTLGRSHHE